MAIPTGTRFWQSLEWNYDLKILETLSVSNNNEKWKQFLKLQCGFSARARHTPDIRPFHTDSPIHRVAEENNTYKMLLRERQHRKYFHISIKKIRHRGVRFYPLDIQNILSHPTWAQQKKLRMYDTFFLVSYVWKITLFLISQIVRENTVMSQKIYNGILTDLHVFSTLDMKKWILEPRLPMSVCRPRWTPERMEGLYWFSAFKSLTVAVNISILGPEMGGGASDGPQNTNWRRTAKCHVCQNQLYRSHGFHYCSVLNNQWMIYRAPINFMF
jgi:hypothetical protein